MEKQATRDDGESLADQARRCLALAVKHAESIADEADGHWVGELHSNASITAEHILFLQSLGHAPIPDGPRYRDFLLSQQHEDGGWSIAPGLPSNVSTSVEAYLALKILGEAPDSPAMRRARALVRGAGGVARVRVFTRIFLAQFGLFPWDAVPQIPAEFILLPSSWAINIYRLASWARSTLVPLMVIRHHQATYALPNGRSAANDFLDELWLDPGHKAVPYCAPSRTADPLGAVCAAVDAALYWLGGLRRWPLRRHALRRCVAWIVEHQEPAGDWAGIVPPMHASVQALLLEGYPAAAADGPVARGMAALERFTLSDARGKRLQACVSPVWDTVLMTRALCDAGAAGRPCVARAVAWIQARQLLGPEGDWRVLRPALAPGGFSFEYHNAWYPDADDTAAAVLALVDAGAGDAGAAATMARAVAWLCGMQNRDGGWAAFDVDNDRLWLNKVPFSDMDALCDPSSADVTRRVLEALGRVLDGDGAATAALSPDAAAAAARACDAAVGFLGAAQEPSGAWFGRWGCNYVYGTSNALCGLQRFAARRADAQAMARAGAGWLRRAQNADGGWGEGVESYGDAARAGRGPSTASQTAWGLLGLLAGGAGARDDDDAAAVAAAVARLVATQAGASWPEHHHTGTGFPGFFYIGYSLYAHYFPVMGLGRFLRARGEIIGGGVGKEAAA